eukprot:9428045-Pyramimonas_sp.AAC.1
MKLQGLDPKRLLRPASVTPRQLRTSGQTKSNLGGGLDPTKRLIGLLGLPCRAMLGHAMLCNASI